MVTEYLISTCSNHLNIFSIIFSNIFVEKKSSFLI